MLFVIMSLLILCKALGCSGANSVGSGLENHTEIHDAKNLIDALSFKLHSKLKAFQTKFDKLHLESEEYRVRSRSTKDEIRTLNKLKVLLSDLTAKKSSICEKFYTNFDFTVSRQILINASSSLEKDYTVAIEVNHRDLIDNGLALANGNDLRVYFYNSEDCQPRELDRIVQNIATTKTTVLFKLQEKLPAHYGSSYYIVYGNKGAGPAKQNPENVYLFYDDFADSNLEKKWQKNWGAVAVEDGVLSLNTSTTPTNDHAEVSVFVKHGHEWKDVEVELDFKEKIRESSSGAPAAPGPFLRVEDARIQSTTAWWMEYVVGRKDCTMRPYKNNEDGKWLFTRSITRPLLAGLWYHAKYRVVGDRFTHWLNNKLIHNNVRVPLKWLVTKGTFGLGCHAGKIGCHTFYDNIKITKYTSVLPTVTLGDECKVDVKKFQGHVRKDGRSEKTAATSCKQIHDISLQGGKHTLKNGVYWIKTSADSSAPTFCDLRNGGWTLVGKVSGFVDRLYQFWLIKNHNLDALKSASLPSKVGCIDARYLATNHASTVMISSGEKKDEIGSKWVQWPLPEGRESDSFWTHSVGLSVVSKAKMHPVTVKAWNGNSKVCYQNKYGIMPIPQHGGSYPSASFNTAGNTATNDYCMAVGVQKRGRIADGWSQNANGYDSPRSNSDWPNSQYNHQSPFVTVWLK